MNLLEEIVLNKKQEVKARKKIISTKKLKNLCQNYLTQNIPQNIPRSLEKAILTAKPVGLIAEIKLASPISGSITEMNCVGIAKVYADSKADVISVLTDEKYFNGKLSYLKTVRKICPQPIFRKDFIIDVYQIYETLVAGADALLLMASVLTVQELKKFIKLSNDLNLEFIVEVHDKKDLEKALKVNCKIIGINNRNLKSMTIDLEATKKLIKYIPKNKIIISESGINSYNDVKLLTDVGVRGVLVGSSIIKSNNISKKINELKKKV